MSETQNSAVNPFWKELAVFLPAFIPQVYLLQDAYHFEFIGKLYLASLGHYEIYDLVHRQN
jgi:hypothetical protein